MRTRFWGWQLRPAPAWAAQSALCERGPWEGVPEGALSKGFSELLGQSDDDALRATQEAEPVDVLVLRDLADEFGTVAAQAGNDVVDVVDSEHDAAYAQRVRRRAFRLGSDRRRRVELRQLNPAVAVRGPHHGDVGADVVEPDDAVHPTPLDRRLAFQLHTEFGEERFGSLKVVDNDENVVHPLNRHVLILQGVALPGNATCGAPRDRPLAPGAEGRSRARPPHSALGGSISSTKRSDPIAV